MFREAKAVQKMYFIICFSDSYINDDSGGADPHKSEEHMHDGHGHKTTSSVHEEDNHHKEREAKSIGNLF